MEQIVFSQLSLAEFKAAIAEVVEEKIRPFLFSKEADSKDNFLTRQEVASQLKISLPTLRSLTLQGTINGYRMGGSKRVLYKSREVEAALLQIVSNKYKRRDLLGNSEKNESK